MELAPHEQLDRMITGYWVSQAIYAAAKFDIADHLAGGPKSVEELAAATETNPDALYRLLRALASVGIFAEGESRQFSLTPLAKCPATFDTKRSRCSSSMTSRTNAPAWLQKQLPNVVMSFSRGPTARSTNQAARWGSLFRLPVASTVFGLARPRVKNRRPLAERLGGRS